MEPKTAISMKKNGFKILVPVYHQSYEKQKRHCCLWVAQQYMKNVS